MSILNETLITLAAAGKKFPGRGAKHICPSTVFRWVTDGTKTAGGAVVRLESIRVGRRLLTSEEALTRYVEALSAGPNPVTSGAKPDATGAKPRSHTRTPSQRKRESDRADRELRQRGVVPIIRTKLKEANR